jgi:BirA family biotin operon repressor/biotin-[acetyl-CoA-carboxylase] ligase
MKLIDRLRVDVRNRVDVFFLDTVDSTNTCMKTMAAQGMLKRASLLLTDNQTEGRGTRGRIWVQGGAGLDLAMTLALPQKEEVDQRFSLAVGATVALAVEKATNLRLGVKWPNDLLAQVKGSGWRKAGGVLIETSGEWLFTGVGINVNSTANRYPPELAASMTTLRDAAEGPVDRDAVIESVAFGLYELAGTDLKIEAHLEQWMERDKTGGQQYTYQREGESIQVAAERVDPGTGHLICVDQSGNEHYIRSYRELDAAGERA